MDDDKIKGIVSNQNNVEDIISSIVDNFPYVVNNINPYHYKDPYAYYLTGHCTSFSRILYGIFDGCVEIYDSNSHVITKICNHYYDVRGCVDRLVDLSKYRYCSINDLLFVEMYLGFNDAFDERVKQNLISIGKDKLLEIFDSRGEKKLYYK